MATEELLRLQRDRKNRFLRERKHYRLTKLTVANLEMLSRFYQTGETAIVEAGIQMLYDCHQFDRLGDSGQRAPLCPSTFEGSSAEDQTDLIA